MGKVAPPRIFGLLAPEGRKVVLVRRGPHRVTQLLLWDLQTDHLTVGSRIEGKVFYDVCDVSPDGRYFILFARAPHRLCLETDDCWTALIEPPFVEDPLAFWSSCGSWPGGGKFHGNTTLRPTPSAYATLIIPVPATLKVKHSWSLFRRESTLPSGWENTFLGNCVKPFATGRLVETRNSFEIQDAAGNAVRAWPKKPFIPQFMEVDHRGRVIFGDQGCLWAWEDFPNGRPYEVADLRS